jgi:ABC-type transport system substrate-binding protein
MLIDRDKFTRTFYNIDGYERAGIEAGYNWNTHIPASWGPTYWTDPKTKSSSLGEGGKYFQLNPDEAAKLLKAANAFGVEQVETYHTGNAGFGGPSYGDEMQVIAAMLEAGGHFKIKPNVVDSVSVEIPNYLHNGGDFDGFVGAPEAAYPDMDLLLWTSYTPSGRNPFVWAPVPTVQPLLEKHRHELDEGKRQDILHQIEKELAKGMNFVPRPGIGQGFTVHWPWLSNYDAVRSWNTNSAAAETLVHWWYDSSKQG